MPKSSDGYSLEDVLATDELAQRRPRLPDYRTESAALYRLIERLVESPSDAMQRLVDVIIELCLSESAGVSLLQGGDNEGMLKWCAVGGRWSPFEGELIPFESPCGVVVERNMSLLFISPERHFPVTMLDPPAHELLLAPVHLKGRAIGTIWAVMHETNRGFDAEDVRLLENLARFASLAFQMDAGLAESEARFETLMKGIPQLVWRAAPAGYWSWSSPQWSSFTGQNENDSRGWGWLEMVAAEDREGARSAWDRANAEDGFDADYRIWNEEDKSYRWFQTRATPVVDNNEVIVEWLGMSTDVDEIRRLSVQQRALLTELQHRVRNSLAIIRSIARRTADNSRNIAEFRHHFEGRLNAFARAQTYITRYPGLGVNLAELIHEELLAHHADKSSAQVKATGPDVEITPHIADVLILAINELVTNSVKFGALAADDGEIAVNWYVDSISVRTLLRIDWTENVPSGISPTENSGFGREYICSVLPYELDAECSFSLQKSGMRCSMNIPLEMP